MCTEELPSCSRGQLGGLCELQLMDMFDRRRAMFSPVATTGSRCPRAPRLLCASRSVKSDIEGKFSAFINTDASVARQQRLLVMHPGFGPAVVKLSDQSIDHVVCRLRKGGALRLSVRGEDAALRYEPCTLIYWP